MQKKIIKVKEKYYRDPGLGAPPTGGPGLPAGEGPLAGGPPPPEGFFKKPPEPPLGKFFGVPLKAGGGGNSPTERNVQPFSVSPPFFCKLIFFQ